MVLLRVRCAGVVAGFPLPDVVEVMRPLPLLPLPAPVVQPLTMPPAAAAAPAPGEAANIVVGAARIRSRATPVVDLGLMLGSADSSARQRWLLLRTGERMVAVAVDRVLGLQTTAGLPDLPPLFGSEGGMLHALAARDQELEVVLSAIRLLDAEAWAAFDDALARTPA